MNKSIFLVTSFCTCLACIFLGYAIFGLTVNNKTQENIELQTQNEMIIDQLNILTASNSTLTNDKTQLLVCLADLNSKYDDAQSEIGDLKEQLRQAQASGTADAETISNLQLQLQQKQSQLDDLLTKINEYELRISNLELQLSDSNNTIESLVSELNKSNELFQKVISGEVTEITVEDFGDITEIRPYAFYGCSQLISVEFPDTLTSIGDYAFSYCFGLTAVEIPNSLKTAGMSAFEGCFNLKSIYVSDISIWASIDFYNETANPCSVYESSSILGVGHRGGDLIIDGEKISENIVLQNITSIGSYSFCNMNLIKSVSIPNSVTRVKTGAFHGCTNLDSVYISDVDSWAGISFSHNNANPLSLSQSPKLYLGNQELTDIVLTNVINIGIRAFEGYVHLKSVTIPNSVTDIGSNAFSGCIVDSVMYETSGDGYVFENGILTITKSMSISRTPAWYSDSLNPLVLEVVFDDSIEFTCISQHAFWGCSSLTSITIPSSIYQFGNSSFLNCLSLTSLIVLRSFPPDLNGPTQFFTKIPFIYVPDESIDLYKTDEGITAEWSRYSDYIYGLSSYEGGA